MTRTRTIKAAAEYFREADPDTAVTQHFIRQLILTGAIPAAKAGKKYLVNLDVLESYLTGEYQTAAEPEPEREPGKIRPVPVH